MELLVKLGIVVVLLAIIVSLGSGLFFLTRDRSQSRRTLNALTVRIALSMTLFLLIVAGLASGYLKPNSSPLASPPPERGDSASTPQ